MLTPTRPRAVYRLTGERGALFPKGYAGVAACALQFTEKKLGRDAVEQALHERQGELFKKHSESL